MRKEEEIQKKVVQEPELHQAAKAGEDIKFSDLLEEPGVDIFSKNSAGLTALTFAEEKIKQNWFNKKDPFIKIVKLIEKHLFYKLWEAMKKSDEEFERYLNLTKEIFPSILKAVLIGPEYWARNKELSHFGLLVAAMPFASESSKNKQRSRYKIAEPIGLEPERGFRCIELILEMGKALGFYSPIEINFLAVAAYYASPEMLKLLISKGVAKKISPVNSSPLNAAIYSNQIESVKLIMAWWPHLLTLREEDGFYPSHKCVVRNGNVEIVELICKAAKLSNKELLIEAIQNDKKEVLDFALNSASAADLNEVFDRVVSNPSAYRSEHLFSLVERGAGAYIDETILGWARGLSAAELIEPSREALKLLLRSGSYLFHTSGIIWYSRACITEQRSDIMNALCLTEKERIEFSSLFRLIPHRMKIFELIEKNDFKGLELFLQEAKTEFSPADFMKILNSRDEEISTPLQKAKVNGFNKCVKLLEAENAPEQFSLHLEIPPKNKARPLPSAPPLEPQAAEIHRKNSMELIRKDRQAPREPALDPHVLRLKKTLEEIEEKNIDTQGVEDEFICPISREIMIDPILASDGNSYERAEFSRYIETRKQKALTLTSPVTGEVLQSEKVYSNIPLRKLIIKHCENLLVNHKAKELLPSQNARIVPPLPSLILEANPESTQAQPALKCEKSQQSRQNNIPVNVENPSLASPRSITESVLANTSPVFTRAASPVIPKQDPRYEQAKAAKIPAEQEAPIKKKSAAVTKKTLVPTL